MENDHTINLNTNIFSDIINDKNIQNLSDVVDSYISSSFDSLVDCGLFSNGLTTISNEMKKILSNMIVLQIFVRLHSEYVVLNEENLVSRISNIGDIFIDVTNHLLDLPIGVSKNLGVLAGSGLAAGVVAGIAGINSANFNVNMENNGKIEEVQADTEASETQVSEQQVETESTIPPMASKVFAERKANIVNDGEIEEVQANTEASETQVSEQQFETESTIPVTEPNAFGEGKANVVDDGEINEVQADAEASETQVSEQQVETESTIPVMEPNAFGEGKANVVDDGEINEVQADAEISETQVSEQQVETESTIPVTEPNAFGEGKVNVVDDGKIEEVQADTEISEIQEDNSDSSQYSSNQNSTNQVTNNPVDESYVSNSPTIEHEITDSNGLPIYNEMVSQNVSTPNVNSNKNVIGGIENSIIDENVPNQITKEPIIDKTQSEKIEQPNYIEQLRPSEIIIDNGSTEDTNISNETIIGGIGSSNIQESITNQIPEEVIIDDSIISDEQYIENGVTSGNDSQIISDNISSEIKKDSKDKSNAFKNLFVGGLGVAAAGIGLKVSNNKEKGEKDED